MKKAIFSVFALMTLTLSLNAQVFLSGDVSTYTGRDKAKYDNTTVKGDLYYSSKVGVKGGYFFNDDFAIGLNLRYDFSINKNSSHDRKDFDRSLNFYPFVQYYFLHSGNFAFGAEASAGISVEGGYLKDENVKHVKGKENTFFTYVSPVAMYWLSDNWALTTSLGKLYFEHSWSGDEHKYIINDCGLDLSLASVTFGVLYRF